MSDLSDFRRMVYEPEVRALQRQVAALRVLLQTAEREAKEAKFMVAAAIDSHGGALYITSRSMRQVDRSAEITRVDSQDGAHFTLTASPDKAKAS